jgi:hypothetical protein
LDEFQFAYTANAKKQNYDVEITQHDEKLNELKTLSLDSNKKLFALFEPIVHYGEKAIYVLDS